MKTYPTIKRVRWIRRQAEKLVIEYILDVEVKLSASEIQTKRYGAAIKADSQRLSRACRELIKAQVSAALLKLGMATSELSKIKLP